MPVKLCAPTLTLGLKLTALPAVKVGAAAGTAPAAPAAALGAAAEKGAGAKEGSESLPALALLVPKGAGAAGKWEGLKEGMLLLLAAAGAALALLLPPAPPPAPAEPAVAAKGRGAKRGGCGSEVAPAAAKEGAAWGAALALKLELPVVAAPEEAAA